jgi:hypothetical protein
VYGKRPSAGHNRGGGGSFSRPKNDGNLYTRSNRLRKTTFWGKEKKAAKPSACFVTSACVESRGLPNDCYELCLLRLFRREYVAKRPDGARVLAEYEDKAPKIVSAIDALGREKAKDVYGDLYERGVKRSVCLIQNGLWGEAYELYRAICEELEETYHSIGPKPSPVGVAP